MKSGRVEPIWEHETLSRPLPRRGSADEQTHALPPVDAGGDNLPLTGAAPARAHARDRALRFRITVGVLSLVGFWGALMFFAWLVTGVVGVIWVARVAAALCALATACAALVMFAAVLPEIREDDEKPKPKSHKKEEI